MFENKYFIYFFSKTKLKHTFFTFSRNDIVRIRTKRYHSFTMITDLIKVDRRRQCIHSSTIMRPLNR